jgi:hypothetical protein
MYYNKVLAMCDKKNALDHQISVATNNSTLCTVSDVVFALSLLEDSFC